MNTKLLNTYSNPDETPDLLSFEDADLSAIDTPVNLSIKAFAAACFASFLDLPDPMAVNGISLSLNETL